VDDETIEQKIREKNLLTDDQIESVHQAIRDAAAADEELSFIDAAVRLNLMSAEAAAGVQAEADREISSAETGEISGELAGSGTQEEQAGEPGTSADSEQDTEGHPVEGEQAAAGEQAEAESAEVPSSHEQASGEQDVKTENAEAASESGGTISVEESKPAKQTVPLVPLILGAAVLIALIVIVAVLNQPIVPD